MSLAHFRYSLRYQNAIGMSTFKEMFGIDAFETLGGLQAEAVEDDVHHPAQELPLLYKTLIMISI